MTGLGREPLDAFIDGLVDAAGCDSIMDLGCGKGVDLGRFGVRAASDARLIGVDISEPAIAQARADTPDNRFAFLVQDIAERVPAADASMDLIYSRNALECIVDKPALLAEIHRVLKPGGRVVCAHFDWDSQAFDGDDKALVRRVVQAYNDWQQAWMRDSDAWMGRRLWRTFQETGLFKGEVRAHVLTETRYEPGCYGYDQAQSFTALVRRGLISQTDLDSFLQPLQLFAARGIYFYGVTMYAYVGTKLAG